MVLCVGTIDICGSLFWIQKTGELLKFLLCPKMDNNNKNLPAIFFYPIIAYTIRHKKKFIIFSRHWNIQYEQIKYHVKFQISQFIHNLYLASSWAVFYHSVASSFSYFSFSIQYGLVKCTTCLASSS